MSMHLSSRRGLEEIALTTKCNLYYGAHLSENEAAWCEVVSTLWVQLYRFLLHNTESYVSEQTIYNILCGSHFFNLPGCRSW